jgi:hypothetical protein
VVQENLKLLIVAIIVLSVLPGVIELFATSGRRQAGEVVRPSSRDGESHAQRFDHFFIPCSGML